ncbi:MAG: phosphotransferase [Acidimicrobiales bacterium]
MPTNVTEVPMDSDHIEIPDRPEAVTAAWLTEALRGSLPEIEVTGVTVLDQHSGTTGRLRLGLEYAPDHTGPETLFVKLAPDGESQQKLVAATDMGRKEARFYEELAAEVPLRVPGCLFAAHGDERTEYVMVLEDLEASGCTFTSRLESGAEEHGRKVVEALARLHAHFWEDSRFDGELAWIPPAMRGKRGALFVQSALEQFGDDFPPVFTELCRLYIDHDDEIVELWDEGERTLVHGDTHAGNQFVDGDEVGLYDWAVISRSPGIRDIAIYLGNSCPTEIRQREEVGWLRAYRQVLVDAGVDAPADGVLWDRYRRLVLYAWIGATTTAAAGSRWQPIEVGMLGMTRATQTCADLGTVEAYRAVL